MKNLKLLALFITAIAFTSCSDDDDAPEVINEEEVITDVTLTFTNESNEETTYTFTDPQYRDENYVEPVILLNEGEIYQVETNFYNNSNPQDPELITTEVQEERDDHFVTYSFSEASIDLNRTDSEASTDSNGVQIGLFTEWITTETSSGEVMVRLIHQPESKDTSDGYGSFTGGETDVEVSFDVEIQ